MADKKITALTDLGKGITGSDLFHVIDDPDGTPVNKKVSVENVFQNIPTWIGLSGAPQSLNAAGAVSVTESITNLTLSGTAAALTLADGAQGQIKIIVCTDGAGAGTMTCTPSNLLGSASIAWDSTGDSWTGIFDGESWCTLSAVGVTLG